MESKIHKHLSKSCIFGIVMSVIGFFYGKTQYSHEEAAAFPPAWQQLLLLFVAYAVTYLVLAIVFEWGYEKLRK